MESMKRRRSANFTNNEKILLLNIISRYKSVIENKKYDGATIRDKNEAWKKITQQFNSLSANPPRDLDCLRGCYENRKKLLRKSEALKRRERYKTSGVSPKIEPKIDSNDEPADDLLLSVVSEKKLEGLGNYFDGDASGDAMEKPLYENQISYENLHEEDVSPSLNIDDFETSEIEEFPRINWMNKQETPENTTDRLPTYSRQKPRTIFKAPTNSKLVEKYNLLLNKRLQVAEYQKQYLKNQIEMGKREHELRVKLLLCQIQNQRKNSTNF